MPTHLLASGILLVTCIRLTWLRLRPIIGSRWHSGSRWFWSRIRVVRSWLRIGRIGSGLHIRIIRPRSNIRIVGFRLCIGRIGSRRQSWWCRSQASTDIICPALTQDAERLLWTANRFDQHNTATSIKLALIVVGILFGHPYAHPVISRVGRGSGLARKQTLEVLDKTV